MLSKEKILKIDPNDLFLFYVYLNMIFIKKCYKKDFIL